jgi:hypothetical protein
MNIGVLPAAYGLLGILYMLGGLLFGIATLRAGILPRWPAGLLAVAALLTPAAALLPHDIQRLAAIPVGLALAWLGYALWSERSERRAQASDPAPRREAPSFANLGATHSGQGSGQPWPFSLPLCTGVRGRVILEVRLDRILRSSLLWG